MRIKMHVEYDGKQHEVTAGVADVIALEDEFDIDASSLGVKTKMKWLAFLAWNAMRRGGIDVPAFKEFAEGLEGLDVEQGNE